MSLRQKLQVTRVLSDTSREITAQGRAALDALSGLRDAYRSAVLAAFLAGEDLSTRQETRPRRPRQLSADASTLRPELTSVGRIGRDVVSAYSATDFTSH